MKLTKTTALRLMALSGLLPLLYIISSITTQGYPQVEPTFPQLIISGIIVLLTAAILICGVIGGIILSKETVSFAAIFFTIFSGIMVFFLLIYALIIFGTENPLRVIFGMGDFAGFGFGLTAIFYAVCLFSHVKKDGRNIKTLSVTYGVFGILGIMQYIMIMVLGNRTEGGNPNDPLFYSLFTMDALTVTCIIPAILGVILLILLWRSDLPIAE